MSIDRVEWRKRTTEDIYSFLDIQQIQKIFSDVSTREDFDSFLGMGIGEFWILYDIQKNQPIAFTHLHLTAKGNNIEVHGGSWASNLLMTYKGFLALLDKLFSMGYGIRTSCLCNNQIAFRFLHSVGFIKYRKDNAFNYMWLDKNRFKNTSIYRRMI